MLRDLEFGDASHINVAIAILIWLMIYPMMLKIDLTSLLGVRKRPGGLLITLFVNWIVKPFSMALLGWVFFKHLFLPWIGAELADQYVAGVIILAAAPCTAMVFVWSYLTEGDPAYTLVQVSLNDLIMLVLFAPIVGLLVAGASGLEVPFQVLVWSVVAFIVIPLVLGSLSRAVLIRAKGRAWFEEEYLPFFHPVTTAALLATLVLIFAFQADNLTGRFLHVLLIAVPILIQVYFNSGLAYGLMRWFRIPHDVAAPGALIGASNFFELAVAVAITLFGADSGAALATVVGVLVEVPVMLSVCAACNRTRHWFPPAVPARAPSWLAGAFLAVLLAGLLPVSASDRASTPSEGRALLQRGVELRRSDPARAGPILEEALDHLEAEGDLSGQAEAHRNLGVLERLAGRNEEALKRFEIALDLGRRSGDDAALAEVLNSVGILHRARGDLRRALETNAEGLALARKAGDLIAQARLLGSIARTREELGDLDGSERAARLGIVLAERGQAPSDLAAALSGHLGILMAKRGELWEALRLFDRIEEMPGGKPAEEWGRNNTRALIYRGMGDLDRAEQYARRAIETARQAGGLADILGCQHNLALILEDRGDVEGARALLRETLAGLEQLDNKPRILFTLNSLSVLELERGDLSTAREWNEQSMRLIQHAGLIDPFPIEETLRTRSRLARASGDLDLALQAGREALHLAGTSEDAESLSRAHEWMGELEMEAGHQSEAEAHLREAVARHRGIRSLLPPEERLMLRRHVSRPWRRLASALLRRFQPSREPGLLVEALELLDESHARTLVEMIAQRRPVTKHEATATGDASAVESKAVGAAIAALQSDLLSEPDQEKRQALKRQLLLEEDRLAASRRKKAAAPPLFAAPAGINLPALKSALENEHAALISFALGPPDGWALIAGAGSLEAVAIPDWEEIGRLAAGIEPLLGGSAGPGMAVDPLAALDRLSEKLLDPWFSHLPPDVDRLIIVPDGILERVPFEALRPLETGGTRRRYLVESHSVAYVPSASSWLALRSRTRQKVTPGTVLAVADPVLAAADSPRLPPLPAGREEARRLMGMASSRSLLLIGEEATEARWRNEDLARFELIHLAVHGVADLDHPLRAGIVLSAGDAQQDGWIQMREILGTPLAAELVVLCSCRSAVGPVDRAEGIISLPSAFLDAGARAVVATLWEVGDGASAEFMERFYRAVMAGGRPADALRAAKLEMIASKEARLSRAGAWAPFILVGDTSAQVTLGGRRGAIMLVIALAAALVALLGVRLARSRKAHGRGSTRNSP